MKFQCVSPSEAFAGLNPHCLLFNPPICWLNLIFCPFSSHQSFVIFTTIKTIIYTYIWVNYNISLTWNKAIWGWFPLLTVIPVRSQWGRYNFSQVYIYIYAQRVYIYIIYIYIYGRFLKWYLQITIGFNTKSWSNLGWFGVPLFDHKSSIYKSPWKPLFDIEIPSLIPLLFRGPCEECSKSFCHSTILGSERDSLIILLDEK